MDRTHHRVGLPDAGARPARRIGSRPLALVLIVAAIAGPVVPASAADGVPYTDPSVVGFIGLCDAADHDIDHGSVVDQPFVRSAVSSVAAIAPYDGDGRTATLYAYQPREGTEPSEWSGQLLTASTQYADPAHPTAVATAGDDSLATFLDVYPTRWDGLIQLRIYLGAPGQAALTQQYAATDIRIKGDTWTVVRGGSAPCDASAAHSIEELLPTTTADPAATTTQPRAAANDSDSSGPGASLVASIVGLGLLLVVVVVVVRRRRSSRPG